MDVYFTVNEACEYAGWKRTKLYYLRKQNKLPYFKEGKQVTIRKSAIDEYKSRFETTSWIGGAQNVLD